MKSDQMRTTGALTSAVLTRTAGPANAWRKTVVEAPADGAENHTDGAAGRR